MQAGYGPPPPYEIEYLNGAQDPSQALQLLAREYTAAGARIGERTAERQDYLGLELAFASYLAAREAEAWGSGDATLAEDLAHAGQDFLCRHPGRWVGRFCTKALPEAHRVLSRLPVGAEFPAGGTASLAFGVVLFVGVRQPKITPTQTQPRTASSRLI